MAALGAEQPPERLRISNQPDAETLEVGSAAVAVDPGRGSDGDSGTRSGRSMAAPNSGDSPPLPTRCSRPTSARSSAASMPIAVLSFIHSPEATAVSHEAYI